MFSRNSEARVKAEICGVLQVNEGDPTQFYLGLPNVVGGNKMETFKYIKDRVWQRISSWNRKTFSRAGKEVLLKAVAQAIPNFAMSVFLLPMELCEAVERLFNSFWWGMSVNGDKNMRWLRWRKMCHRKDEGGLGFRELHHFNMALLGKQIWRLATDPDSLVAQVYKAKYYPDCSVFDAQVGHNPSFIWRSLLAAQNYVKMGSVWRVGDGSQIRVWGDPWLFGSDEPYVSTTRVMGLEDLRVQQLRMADSPCWDWQGIGMLLNQDDQQKIQRIPLSIRNTKDNLVWIHSQDGKYSVRSGYHLIQSNHGMVNSEEVRQFWKKFWKVKVPAKVLNLCWRACNQCLPVKVLLRRRRVCTDEICPCCGGPQETALHALVECSRVRGVWLNTRVGYRVFLTNDFFVWLQEMSKLYTGADFEQVLITCWSIWNSRNAMVWKQKVIPMSQTSMAATSLLHNWKAARGFLHQDVMAATRSPATKWKPPPEDTLKLNSDAALHTHQNCTGFGFVLRNKNGLHLGSSSWSCPGLFPPSVAEAIGVREALSWLKMNQHTKVEVETDCKSIADFLERGSNISADNSIFHCLLLDCRFLLEQLRLVSVSFVPRSANQVAHLLAKATDSMSGTQVWGLTPPNFLLTALAVDVSDQ